MTTPVSDRYKITYIAPGSSTPIELTGTGGVRLLRDGITGLIGGPTVETTALSEVPGQAIISTTTEAFTGSLTVHITDSTTLDEFLAGFSPINPGQLTLTTPAGTQLTAYVRLEKPPAAPGFNPTQEKPVQVSVDVVCDDGVWWTAPTTVGTLGEAVTKTIANPGDVHVFPVLTWSTSSSTRLPSGAVVSLPAPSTGTRKLSLSHRAAGVITDANGVPDWEMSKQVPLVPEGIPPHTSRTLTHTGLITYRVGFWNPWTRP